MDEKNPSLETRVAVIETRQDAHEKLIEDLQDDIKETRAMLAALESRLSSKWDEFRSEFRSELSALKDKVAEGAANLPPRFAWGVGVVLGVLGVIIGFLSAVAGVHR